MKEKEKSNLKKKLNLNPRERKQLPSFSYLPLIIKPPFHRISRSATLLLQKRLCIRPWYFSLQDSNPPSQSLVLPNKTENEGVHFDPHRTGWNSGRQCLLGALLP